MAKVERATARAAVGYDSPKQSSGIDQLFCFSEPDIHLVLTTNERAESQKRRKHARFILPNELYPSDAVSILAQAPKGVYVSVGTERGFIGAALTPGASHLLLLDRDPRIVAFNRINIALLKMADSREDYLYLRLKADRAGWVARASRLGLSHQFRELLGDPSSHQYWRKVVQDNKEWSFFHHDPKDLVGSAKSFGKANYLHNDILFWKVKSMADRDAIDARLCDFGNPADLQRTGLQMNDSGHKISVLDLSNAWWSNFLGDKTGAVLKAFRPNVEENSLFVISSRRARGTGPPVVGKWGYAGFTFDHIYSWESMRDFTRGLKRYRAMQREDQGKVVRETSLKPSTNWKDRLVRFARGLFT